MNIDDSRLIVRFQRLITEMLVEKQLQVLDRLTPENDGPTAMFSRTDRPPVAVDVAFMGRALPLHAVLEAGA
jgi:hypothetical protein